MAKPRILVGVATLALAALAPTGQAAVAPGQRVDESTWGKPYRLRPVGSAGEVDLDIGFFPRFRPLIVYNEDYHPHATRRQGGESGIVPAGMTRAIVCLHTGS